MPSRVKLRKNMPKNSIDNNFSVLKGVMEGDQRALRE